MSNAVQVAEAWLAITSGSVVADPAQFAAANQGILDLTDTPSAWVIFLELLRSSALPGVRLTAAALLGKKVRTHVHMLGEEDRARVLAGLWGAVAALPEEDVPSIRATSLAIAAMIARWRGPMKLSNTVQELRSNMLSHAHAQALAPTRPFIVAVEVLRAAADEIKDLPPGRGTSTVTEEMRTCADSSLALLSHALEDVPASPFRLRGLIEGTVPATPMHLSVVASAFKAAESWVYAASRSLADVYVGHRALLTAALSAVFSLPDAVVACAASSFITTVLRTAAENRSHTRQEALDAIAQSVLSAIPYIRNTLLTRRSDILVAFVDVVGGMLEHASAWTMAPASPAHAANHSVAVVEFPLLLPYMDGAATASMATLASTPAMTCTMAAEPVTLGVLIAGVGMMLCDAQHMPLVTEKALASFVDLAYVPMDERHAFFKRSCYAALVQLIHRRVMYPILDPTTRLPHASNPVDSDDFLALRGSHAAAMDLLSDAFSVLRGDMLGVIVQSAFAETAHAREALAKVGVAEPLQGAARPLEAAFYCLRVVASDLCTLLHDAETGVEAVDGAVEEMLVSLVLLVTRDVPVEAMTAELAISACQWMAQMAEWVQNLSLSRALRTSSSLFAALPLQAGPVPDVAIGIVNPHELVVHILRMLSACLGQAAAPVAFRRSPRPDTIETVMRVLEGSGSTSAFRAQSVKAYEADSDDEEATDIRVDEQSSANVAAAAAYCMGTVLRRCKPELLTADILLHVTASVQRMKESRLPVSWRAHVFKCTLEAAHGLWARDASVSLFDFARQPIDSMVAACNTLLSQHASAGVCDTRTVGLELVQDIALLHACFRSRAADPVIDATEGPHAVSPLTPVVEGTWSAIESVLIPVAQDGAVVAACLMYLHECIRCCPRLVVGRVGGFLTVALQLLRIHAHPQALVVITAALGALPTVDGVAIARADGDVKGRLAADVQGLFSQVVHATSSIISERMAAGADPEILAEFFRLMCAAFGPVPQSVLTDDVLGAVLVAAGNAMLTLEQRPARAANDFLGLLLMPPHLTAPAELSPALQRAFGAHGSTLLMKLLSALVDERAGNIVIFIKDAIHSIFVAFADKGAAEVTTAVLVELSRQRVAIHPERVPGPDDPMDAQTGLECMSPSDWAAVIGYAAQLARSHRRLFNQIFGDIGNLSRGTAYKDALLAHQASFQQRLKRGAAPSP